MNPLDPRELGDQPTSPPTEELARHSLVDDRYEVLSEIGRGSQGRTYIARDTDDDVLVALKELAFAELDSWKSLELFHREARALRAIDHPFVPRFIDTFHIETEEGPPRFFLVQEFVEGESLDIAIARGERSSEQQLVDFARKMLEILEHLHDLQPPVIHRDIKPSNIIRSGHDYRLVDFGAVQLSEPDGLGGSTVVGTSGYMPPEQLTGRASAQSDLYALGATLIHLVTHVHPSQLPQTRLRIDWRDRAHVSDSFADFVDRLVEPMVEDRFRTAEEARLALKNVGGVIKYGERPTNALHVQRPRSSDVRLHYDGPALIVDMSQSTVAPRVIGSLLGLSTGIFLTIMLVQFFWVPLLTLVGLGASLLVPVGPKEKLRLAPGGRFRFTHQDGKIHRETSGSVDRLTLEGSKLHLLTDGGSFLTIAEHCTPQTRRWIFARVDEYLRDND